MQEVKNFSKGISSLIELQLFEVNNLKYFIQNSEVVIQTVLKQKDKTLLFSALSQLTYWLSICICCLLCMQIRRVQLEVVRGENSVRNYRTKKLNCHKSIVGQMNTLNIDLRLFQRALKFWNVTISSIWVYQIIL